MKNLKNSSTVSTTIIEANSIYNLAKIARNHREVAKRINNGEQVTLIGEAWFFVADNVEIPVKTVNYLVKKDQGIWTSRITTVREVTKAKKAATKKVTKPVTAKKAKVAEDKAVKAVEPVKEDKPVSKYGRYAEDHPKMRVIEFAINKLAPGACFTKKELLTKINESGDADVGLNHVNGALNGYSVNTNRTWIKDGDCDPAHWENTFVKLDRVTYALYDSARDGLYSLKAGKVTCTLAGIGFEIAVEETDAAIEAVK